MFDYITGVIQKIYPTYAVVEVQGIGYKIMVANPFRLQDDMKKETTILLEQIVREDSMTLYGFLSEEERHLFNKLISVSGIGPKSAISILANDDFSGFIQAVDSENIRYLTKFPGVGKKTAQQIILDLKGSLAPVEQTNLFQEEQPVAKANDNAILDDAKEALLGLGYSAKEVTRVWKQMTTESFETTEEALRKDFTLLMK